MPWRLFVAAPLPTTAATQVWRRIAMLRQRHPNARWLPPRKLHLTLVFLGPSDPARVPEIANAVDAAAALWPPFDVRTGQAGGRIDDRRGGVAWLRLAAGERQFVALAADVNRRITGNASFDRPARPHLTIARGVSAATLDDIGELAPGLDIDWVVNRIALLRSHTEPSGSRYEELVSLPLTGVEQPA